MKPAFLLLLLLLLVSTCAAASTRRDPAKCGRAVAAHALRGPVPQWLPTPRGCQGITLPAPFRAVASLWGPEIRLSNPDLLLGVLYDRAARSVSTPSRRTVVREHWTRERGRPVHITETEEFLP